MSNRIILILGGYGGVGKPLSRLLLKETDVDLIVAGRRKAKAEEFAGILNTEYDGSRASAKYADATDPESLRDAFQGVDMVVVTATTPMYIRQIAQAALAAECDYLDIMFSQYTPQILSALSADVEKAGRILITQGGFHPGLPAPFIRHAAQYFDDYQKAIVSIAMNARFKKPESIHEIIDAVGGEDAEVLKEGKWKRVSVLSTKNMIKTDFGPRFGVKQCVPMQMSELKPLPDMLGLKETGVYAAGFNPFVDLFLMPLIWTSYKIKNGLGKSLWGRMMYWGTNTFSSRKHIRATIFVLEAEGRKEGRPLKVRIVAEHDNEYFFTACPVVACLKQYIDGSLNKPGVWLMGNAVDASRLIDDMEKMGIQIRTTIKDYNHKREREMTTPRLLLLLFKVRVAGI